MAIHTRKLHGEIPSHVFEKSVVEARRCSDYTCKSCTSYCWMWQSGYKDEASIGKASRSAEGGCIKLDCANLANKVSFCDITSPFKHRQMKKCLYVNNEFVACHIHRKNNDFFCFLYYKINSYTDSTNQS